MITATNLTTSSNTTVFDSNGESAITTLMFCNHSNDDAIINVWVVPGVGNPRATGIASQANQILKDLTIVAGDTFVMDMEKLVLDDKDTIVAQSNVSDRVNSVISSMAIEK
jgi:hypothetical protein